MGSVDGSGGATSVARENVQLFSLPAEEEPHLAEEGVGPSSTGGIGRVSNPHTENGMEEVGGGAGASGQGGVRDERSSSAPSSRMESDSVSRPRWRGQEIPLTLAYSRPRRTPVSNQR